MNVYLLPFGGLYLYFLIVLQRTHKIKTPMRLFEKNTKATWQAPELKINSMQEYYAPLP